MSEQIPFSLLIRKGSDGIVVTNEITDLLHHDMARQAISRNEIADAFSSNRRGLRQAIPIWICRAGCPIRFMPVVRHDAAALSRSRIFDSLVFCLTNLEECREEKLEIFGEPLPFNTYRGFLHLVDFAVCQFSSLSIVFLTSIRQCYTHQTRHSIVRRLIASRVRLNWN